MSGKEAGQSGSAPQARAATVSDIQELIRRKEEIEAQIKANYDVLESVSVGAGAPRGPRGGRPAGAPRCGPRPPAAGTEAVTSIQGRRTASAASRASVSSPGSSLHPRGHPGVAPVSGTRPQRPYVTQLPPMPELGRWQRPGVDHPHRHLPVPSLPAGACALLTASRRSFVGFHGSGNIQTAMGAGRAGPTLSFWQISQRCPCCWSEYRALSCR